MKTYLTYGFVCTLGGALLTLVFYFLGYHSDAAKLTGTEWISNIGMLMIAVACIVLGTKARRSEVPMTREFGYGSAFGAGVLITLFAALFGVVSNYLYMHVINPSFGELIVQAKISAAEAAGANSTKIEQMEKGMRMVMNPLFMGVIAFLVPMFWGTIISLITAAFLKRSASDQSPLVA